MPRQFTDNTGQKWTISITLKKARFVRERLDCDLFNPEDWQELLQSLGTRLAFVWYLVADQAKELELTDEQFEARLYGEGVADNCSNEFLAELADFFRRLGQPGMVTGTDVARESMERHQKRAMDPEFLQAMRSHLETLTRPLDMPGSKSPD